MSDPPARMPEVRREEIDVEVRSFLDRWARGGFDRSDANTLLMTFAHNPQAADLFSQLSIYLLSGTSLPVKIRQLVILRTAWLCKATYMWSSHLGVSLRSGLDPVIFQAVRAGPDDPYFTELERAAISATDELLRDHKIGDANWCTLTGEWNFRQMLDFLFTVGAFTTSAGVLRSAGTRRGADLLELAERYGAPAE